MDLIAFKKELATNTDYTKLDDKSWEEKIHLRDIDVKFDDGIDDLIPKYTQKISNIRYQLREVSTINISIHNKDGKRKSDTEVYEEYTKQADSQWSAIEKQDRLYDKLACCLKEQKLRADKLVNRTPHHTNYYIDYTNGNDANDGLSADNAHAWKTINKYTSVTVRTAGDNAYVRANQTHTITADITGDEDGTIDLWISLIACDATTNDPWSDDSNVKPTLDFGAAAYQINWAGEGYWWLEGFIITNGADADGLITMGNPSSSATNLGMFKLKNCDFSNNTNVTGEAVRCQYCVVNIEGCTLQDTLGPLLSMDYCVVYVNSCTFNAGATNPAVRALNATGSLVYVKDSSFGGTTNFSTAVVYFTNSATEVYLRNCTYSGTLVSFADTANNCKLFVEDADGTYGSAAVYTLNGTITKETASPRAGGSASYAKILPTAYCGPNYPLCLGLPLSGFSPKKLTKDVEYTMTGYARVGSAWDSALSASEAYLKCSYLSNASTAARTEIQSAQTIANDTTWTAFTVTFTPLQTGFAYFWFCLAEYEDASEYIDVDDEPVVS